ncbi:4-alpha-glucanotransferase [Rodentibacter caecimuris]|uniref:4-alpha-glucanotransferase n=1 Tax=Rodentibacter caecimuris TaxID=1796644 RepID=A0ABX3KV72_9PAST|nr:4-alpha-glucanotransferase [Rodentibacter heylii]
MNISPILQSQAEKLGIGLSHYNVDGQLHYASEETLSYFVDYLTLPIDVGKYKHFDTVLACFENEPIEYELSSFFSPELPIHYQLFNEHQQLISQETIDSLLLNLAPLPFGYYQLILIQADKNYSIRLLVTPKQIYQPPILKQKKAWGLNIQLYSLRSQQNWGIGDFGDLALLIKSAVKFGADFIGINPLHQMYTTFPEWASPYASNSRQRLNTLYLNIPALPEFKHCQSVQNWFNQIETQQQIDRLRASEMVNYSEVSQLKMDVLTQLFAYFKQASISEIVDRRTAFSHFFAQREAHLQDFALFETLDQFTPKPRQNVGWLEWRKEWQNLTETSRQKLLTEYAEQIEFYIWLQWLAESQLIDLQNLCQSEGMTLGIYGDLAVNSAKGSVDVWSNSTLFFTEASIGAPPDPLGPVGQNWELPPYNPQALKATGFQPFIDMLRTNMQYFGILRIDHVMGLFRLWLIPEGKTAVEGIYVYYPFDELMAILAIESQRNQCLIVGEDLGTVPDEVRSKLNEFSVFSYFVLYFEQRYNRYPPPNEFPIHAFATVGTHDVCSLAAFWHCRDLELFSQLGIVSGELLHQKYEQRVIDKQALLNRLHEDHYLPSDYDGDALSMAMHPNLNLQIHRYLAHSQTRLIGVQLENLIEQEVAFNVPGTSLEYPNWRKKLNLTLEQIFSDQQIQSFLIQINQARRA